MPRQQELPNFAGVAQPLGEIELAQNHWLANRIAFLSLPGQPTLRSAGFAMNAVATYNLQSLENGPYGPASAGAGSGAGIVYTGSDRMDLLGGRSVFTIFALSKPPVGAQRRPLVFYGDEGGAPFQQINLLTNSDSGAAFSSGAFSYFEFTGGTFQAQADAVANTVDGDWHLFCAVSNGTNVRLYVDGVDVTVSSPTRVGTMPPRSDGILVIHGAAGQPRGMEGPSSLVGVTYDAMSPEEVAALSQDLWGVISPQTRRFISLAAGGTNTALTSNSFSHTHTLSTPAVSRNLLVLPATLQHTHTLGIGTLSTSKQVTASSLSHTQSLSVPTLSRNFNVAANTLQHSHLLDTPIVSYGSLLSVSNLSHTHTVSTASLSLEFPASPVSLFHLHALSAPSVSVTGASSLTTNPLSHNHSISAPALTLFNSLNNSSLEHLHSITSPVLSRQYNLTSNSLSHLHSLGVPSIATVNAFAVTPNALSHFHTLNTALLSVSVSLPSTSLNHAHEFAAPSLSTAIGSALSVSSLTHTHSLGTTTVSLSALTLTEADIAAIAAAVWSYPIRGLFPYGGVTNLY